MSLQEVSKKIDAIISKQSEMNTTLEVMKVDLKYHIRRTDNIEHKLLPIWKVYVAVVIITPLLGGAILFKNQIKSLFGF